MEILYQFHVDWSACKNFVWLIIAIIVEVIVIRCYKCNDRANDTLFDTEEETIFDKIVKKRSVRYEMSIIGLCYIIVLLLYALFNVIDGNLDVYQKFRSGDFNTVSGKVYNFQEGDADKDEVFWVGDVRFGYAEDSWLGYHKLKADGGVINGDGQQVVIGYVPCGVDNVIVYIAQ